MIKINIIHGPETGRSYELSNNKIYIGRSSVNDIKLKDLSVSRRHLKVTTRDGRYYIMDLQSTNGTFINGKEMEPWVEYEVQEGIPIVMGMTVIGVNETRLEDVLPFLKSINWSDEPVKRRENVGDERSKFQQKDMELLQKVSDALITTSSLDETISKALGYLMDLLKRIDRGAIIVVDNETNKIVKTETSFNESLPKNMMTYSTQVVEQVVQGKKAVMIPDVYAEDDTDLTGTLKLMKIGSVICVPLISRSQIRGAIYVDSFRNPNGFRRHDLSLLTTLSAPLAVAIENATLHS